MICARKNGIEEENFMVQETYRDIGSIGVKLNEGNVGGIDLNEINVNRQGASVDIQFDTV